MTERLPLSAAQLGIWVAQALDPHSADFVTAECVELSGAVDVPKLAAATQQALQEADILRATIDASADDVAWQTDSVAALVPSLLTVADASAAYAFMAADARTPFDLVCGPVVRHALLQLPDGRVFWYLAAHHVALDGYAYTLLIQRAGELYAQRTERRFAPGEPFSSLRASADEEARYRSSNDWRRDAQFWQRALRGLSEPVSLSAAPASYPAVPRRSSCELDATSFERLQSYAAGRGPSWLHVLTALFTSFVQERTGADEVVLGMPVLARVGRVALRNPAMMMNLVPVRLAFGEDVSSLLERATYTQRTLNELLPHTRYRYEQMKRDTLRLGGSKRLFGPVLNIMPFARTLHFGSLQARVCGVAAGPVEDLSLAVHPLPQRAGLSLTLEGHPSRYDAQALDQLRDELRAYLMSAQPRVSGAVASRARVEDSEVVLHAEPLTTPALDVMTLVSQGAHLSPERVALIYGEQTLCYGELLQRVSALAALLRRHGVQAGALVALYLAREPDAIVAMLAVLWCGAAYLPLDPAGPSERTRAVLEDAKPQLVIAAEQSDLRVLHGVPCMAWRSGDQAHLQAIASADAAPAYVIYTSGSTGQPNGVVVSRGALAHFVAAARQRYGITVDDVMLQFAPLAFDASVEEIFVTLCSGGRLVLREPDMLDSPAHFLRRCDALQLSVLDLPTAFFHELSFAMVGAGLKMPRTLHTIIIGGEAALPERVRDFVEATQGSVRLLNTYGPTETTVVATCADLSQAQPGDDELPIGLPLAGLSVVLVPDTSGPRGLYQLRLSGPSLANGYLGKRELTARKFVDHANYGRVYCTGDLVRLRKDGQLVFAGRSDDQLKISGHRVELGEIERVLAQHPEVRESVVVVAHGGAQKRLIAHVVAHANLRVDALRSYAGERLLAAAVPSQFCVHQALPKTATGKIDRKTLAALLPAVQDAPLASESELEAIVFAVWREVLGIHDIDLDRDFFALGGQSLQSIQVANRLSLRLKRNVTGALLFKHPTVRGLAQALDTSASASSQRVDDVRAQVENDPVFAEAFATLMRSQPASGEGTVLLTGASGFLGTQLLGALLDQTQRELVCVVRGHSDDQARARLQQALAAQGLSAQLSRERVRVLCGDLSQPQLGLNDMSYASLRESCQVILHNGASVSLARSYSSLRDVNVLSTAQLLRLAASGRPKTLSYVSTLATALGANPHGVLEERFVDYHDGLRDGYSQSKWASERLLARAQESGLPVQVYRLGRLVGPLQSAVVNREDLVWRMVAAGVRAGVLPSLPVREPWTPIDIVARLIVAQALQDNLSVTDAVLNVAPTSLVALADVVRWTRSYGFALNDCAPADFHGHLQRKASEIDAATLAMFQAQEHSALPTIHAIETRACQRAMARARLVWPEIGEPQLHRYLDTCVASGIVPEPLKRARRTASSQTA